MLRRYRAVYSNSARTDSWRAQVPWAYDPAVVAHLATTEVAWLQTAMMMGSHSFPTTGHAFGGWWDASHAEHPGWFALLPPNTTENPGPVRDFLKGTASSSQPTGGGQHTHATVNALGAAHGIVHGTAGASGTGGYPRPTEVVGNGQELARQPSQDVRVQLRGV